jgi:MFS family permease
MFAASFMQLYAMEQLGLTDWQATLVWCAPGLGIVLAAKGWGRMIDKHGHKPVMCICTFFKPIIAVVFIFVTKSTVLWLLPLMFLIDGVWNAGNLVAKNGYMMRIAPRENRSMFIAAILGLSGLCAGLASVAGGLFLERLSGISVVLLGKTWTNYHLLFLVSFLVRVISVILVHRVREPKSSSPTHVLNDFMGVWPLRLLRFPVGMYRNANGGESHGEQ